MNSDSLMDLHMVVLGGKAVGKTTFVRQLSSKSMNTNYVETEVAVETILRDNCCDLDIRLSILDVPGTHVGDRPNIEWCGELIVVIYDSRSLASFATAKAIVESLLQTKAPNSAILLVCNHHESTGKQVSSEELDQFAFQNRLLSLETDLMSTGADCLRGKVQESFLKLKVFGTQNYL